MRHFFFLTLSPAALTGRVSQATAMAFLIAIGRRVLATLAL
jgi:hypothetical protein